MFDSLETPGLTIDFIIIQDTYQALPTYILPYYPTIDNIRGFYASVQNGRINPLFGGIYGT